MFTQKKVVFIGGMCNFINTEGAKVRNPNRDNLRVELKQHNEPYEPQIDLKSHGREYNYSVDGPAEQKARARAHVLVYEIGDATMAGVTMLEVQNDVLKLGKDGRRRNVILWFSSEPNEKGHQVFRPAGFNLDSISDPATKAHAAQLVSQADAMRKNLLAFLEGAANLRIVRSEAEVKQALRDFKVRI